MSQMPSPAFDNAIRNPGDPGHLMVIRQVPRRIRIFDGAALIADTRHALRVMEIGKSFYDPVLYVPEADLKTRLGHVDRTTFCPIKGEASYVSHEAVEIGWVYREPIATARQLAGHHAFWPDKVRIVEGE
ncbi:MAG: DUF427 domain-containing protein [Roseibium sp.]